jgi:hypothetical protein
MLPNRLFLTAIAILFLSSLLPQATKAGDQELAKKSQNPIGDLISLPMVGKYESGLGQTDANRFTLELKPVYPIHLGNVNMINRLIVPVVYQEELAEGAGSEFGLGDTVYQAFFSPREAGEIIWGAGPVFIIPTNTDDRLGNDKLSLGPAAVALTKPGHWLFGGLLQHFWDVAGDSDAASVNLSSLQVFVNYNFPEWYLTTSPTFTYNWYADSGQRWTVPLGGGVGKLVRFGKLPVDLKLTAYTNVEAPDNAADWYAEFQVKFLFPK